MSEVATDAPPRNRLKRLLVPAITLALIAIAFFGLLPALADYGEAWQAITGVSVFALSLIVALSILNQMLGPIPTMVVIPRLQFGHALSARMASTTAANTIPGGGAVGVGLTYAMLGRWHTGAEIGAAVALTGVWNNFAKMLLPAVALLAATMSGIEMGSLVDGALIGVLTLSVSVLGLVVILRSALRSRVLAPIDRFVRWAQRSVGKAPADGQSSPSAAFLRVVGEAAGTRWQWLMLSTVIYHLSIYAVLLACLRGVGIDSGEVHWAAVLAAFSLVRLISTIPLTPGSLGVIEVGLTGLLAVGLSDAATDRVAAAVLLFRFMTYALPTLIGAVIAVAWRRNTLRESKGGRWGDYQPDHFENTSCFRCGETGRLKWRLGQFALVNCPECGQAFMSPRLNHDGRMSLYGDAKYFDAGVYRNESAKGLQRTWATGRLDALVHTSGDPAGKSLFEVGCAYGMFLEAAQERGYRVEGLEFSPVAAETAAQRLACVVHVGEVVQMAPANHDVVAFWDVIEHVPDPGAFLTSAVSLIRPGGFVALSCPRFDSLAARVFRTRWWTLKPHKHIWHFTRRDLRRMLGEADLEEVKMITNPLNRANRWRIDSLVLIARKRQAAGTK